MASSDPTAKVEKGQQAKENEMKAGDRVRILHDWPHKSNIGTVVEVRDNDVLRVLLDEDTTPYAVRPEQVERV